MMGASIHTKGRTAQRLGFGGVTAGGILSDVQAC